jgi:hypothetical protein
MAWKKGATHCPKGHELSPENIGTSSVGSAVCLSCDRISHNRWAAKNRKYFRNYGKKYRRENPQAERHRKYNARPAVKARYRARLLRRYGLSPEQFADLERAQKGRCAICLKRSRGRLCVDHDHKMLPMDSG